MSGENAGAEELEMRLAEVGLGPPRISLNITEADRNCSFQAEFH